MYIDGKRATRLLALVLVGATLIPLGYSLIGGLLASSDYTIRGITLEPNEVKLNLDMMAPEGSKAFNNVAKLIVPSEGGWVKFVVSESTLPGDEVSIDATIRLQGGTRDYTINMPCAAYKGECIRLSTVILGYDEPLYIEGGVYNITVEVSWHSRGSVSGGVSLSLTIEEPP